MIENLEAISGLIFVIFIISIPLACLSVWSGARISEIRGLTFGRILCTAFMASFLTHVVTTIFYVLPRLHPVPGFFIGLLLALFLIKYCLKVPLVQAVLPWLFSIAAQIIAVILGAVLVVGGIKDLFIII